MNSLPVSARSCRYLALGRKGSTTPRIIAIAQKPVKKCGSINIEFGQLFGRIPGLFNILYDWEEGIVYGMVRATIGRYMEAVAIELLERFSGGALLGRWGTLYPF